MSGGNNPGVPADATRFAAADVAYPQRGGAVAALVIADDPTFATIVAEHTARLDTVAPYRPGAFFERELPALRAVLGVAGDIDLLVVDGYVDLNPQGRPGLGARAHAELAIPVIGVAKTWFRGAVHAVPVLRGSSTRPLYVTAAGLPPASQEPPRTAIGWSRAGYESRKPSTAGRRGRRHGRYRLVGSGSCAARTSRPVGSRVASRCPPPLWPCRRVLAVTWSW